MFETNKDNSADQNF